jgi:hypothetical protein
MIARASVLIAVGLAALMTGGLACADDFDIAGHHLKIETLEGYCAASRDDAVDKPLYSMADALVTGVLHTLSIQGDCKDLERYRRERSLKVDIQPTVLIQLNLLEGKEGALAIDRGKFLELMNKMMTSQYSDEIWQLAKRSTTEALARLKEKMGDEISDAKLQDMQVLGVIDRDDLGVYIGIVQKFDNGGKAYVIAGVGASTMINGLPLTVSRTDVYSGPEQFTAITAEVKHILNQLVALNEGNI